jgi:4-hydroxy-tetrahydrodipicolinate synthase
MTAFTADATIRAALAGSGTALITPFRRGEIDKPALRDLVEFQIAGQTSSLVPCGTTGEAATMSAAEVEWVVAIVAEQAAGRIPIIAGTGGNNTAAVIDRTRRVRALGAVAALVVTPYYNKPTQAGLFAHFTAVADAADLPIVLYNVPGRTGVNLLPETVVRLAAHPRIVGIKEASGSLDQASQIVREAPADFVVLSGDDSLTLPIIGVGGRGVISVAANIVPGPVAALVAAALAGDFARARAIHLDLFDLFRALFVETNPAPVKTAAAMLGLCEPELRLPLVPLTESSRFRLEAALAACRFVERRVAAAAD